MSRLLMPGSPAAVPSKASAGRVVLALGFRPFYLLGAAWALAAIALWAAELSGHPLRAPTPPGLQWHAHEMLFGFVAAILTGFSFTAVKAWTDLATPTGRPLLALALLWSAGRAAMLAGEAPLGAALDALFLPLVALAVGSNIARRGQWRNLFLPLMLLLLAACDVVFHLAALGLIAAAPDAALTAALYVVVMVQCVIAGRVIPSFTSNALPGVDLRRAAWVDRGALASSGAALAAAALTAWGPVVCALAALAAALHVVRLQGWRGWRTFDRPILWILHLSYAWIAVGFGLLAAQAAGAASAMATLHAFGVGSTGGLIVAMTTRSSLGHTGRPLKAGAVETVLYACVMLAAMARVCVALEPLVRWHHAGVMASALLWCLAFALFLYRYAPMLASPRLDGRPG